MITAIKQARGFSVAELMVAIGIGLVLTLAISGIYVANTNAFRNQDINSRQQETSKAALDALGYHIRLAGYVDAADNATTRMNLLQPGSKQWLAKEDPTSTDDLLSKFFGVATATQYYVSPAVKIHGLMGCKGLFTAATTLALPWSCTTTGPSALTVAYQVRASMDNAPGTVRTANAYIDTMSSYNGNTGQGADCGGQDVTGTSANPSGPLAINRFYVDTTTKRLMCIGNGDPSHPKPIAEGIEDMYILYGIPPAVVSATTPGDSFVAQYVTADNVTNWARVLTVRVCLQTVSSAKNVAPGVTSYTNCQGTSTATTDGLYRQIVRETFSLRNNILTSP